MVSKVNWLSSFPGGVWDTMVVDSLKYLLHRQLRQHLSRQGGGRGENIHTGWLKTARDEVEEEGRSTIYRTGMIMPPARRLNELGSGIVDI